MEGTPFGRYRLLDLLGRGGMGEVHRAYDTATNRTVALKVLPAQWVDDPQFQERFRREADSAARLTDPHVIPIHGYGEINGRLYVDMRLVEGSDLQSLLANGPLPPARAVKIIEQVAAALNSAHKAGVVHRDVKPSNILVTEHDFAYLIDFGIARAAEGTRITRAGYALGTWGYMAPERFDTDQDPDHRSDIYALTCLLHECLTGQQPFPGNSLPRQYAGHTFSPPPCPSAIQPNVPRGFDPVIAKGMAKKPEQRYKTALELAQAASAALTASHIPAPTPPPSPAPTPPPRPMPPPRPTPSPPGYWSAPSQPSHWASPRPVPPSTYPVPPRSAAGNGLGTAAMVTGVIALLTSLFIVGIIPGIMAVILGFQALRRVRRGQANNNNVAVAALVLGSVAIAFGLVILALYIIGVTTTPS